MGLIENLLTLVFGNGRNAIVETAHVFRENAEAGAIREAELTEAVLAQFGKEFGMADRGAFDRIMDGINRIPRPALAIGTLCLFLAAMVNPVWFSARMQGIALVPEPLWWLLGAIVSFYFGARHQYKGQQFQQSIAATLALVPQVASNIGTLRQRSADSPGQADTQTDAELTMKTVDAAPVQNPALSAWTEQRQR